MERTVTVGTLESSDCIITLRKEDNPVIDIDTIVHDAFYDHIKRLITHILAEEQFDHLSVYCQDKGALDYTITARLITAIKRYRSLDNG